MFLCSRTFFLGTYFLALFGLGPQSLLHPPDDREVGQAPTEVLCSPPLRAPGPPLLSSMPRRSRRLPLDVRTEDENPPEGKNTRDTPKQQRDGSATAARLAVAAAVAQSRAAKAEADARALKHKADAAEGEARASC